MPRKVPPEFKRDVVTVARRGELTVAEVAADFDISVESVRRWMRQADVDEGVKDGLNMRSSLGWSSFGAGRVYRWRARPCAPRVLEDAPGVPHPTTTTESKLAVNQRAERAPNGRRHHPGTVSREREDQDLSALGVDAVRLRLRRPVQPLPPRRPRRPGGR
jgi:transposase-like protein